jgi:hypothetical protein
VSAVAEEDARVASRRRTVVTLKGWGPTVQRIDRDGGNNEKSSVYQHLSSRLQLRESWQSERGCGRRCQSGVTTSYGRDTQRMGSNGPKNRP